MKTAKSTEQAELAPPGTALILKGVVALFGSLVVLGALLFLLAGRLDWVMAWVWLGLLTVCLLINLAVLWRVNPEVIDERIHVRKGVKGWDKVLSPIMGMFAIGALLVAALNQRFGWRPEVATWLQIAAVAPVLLGDLLFLWAMAVNKFFSKFIRIQEERGHHVVTAGPYQYVRHPGYIGWIVMWSGMTLMLGSLWALVPAGLAVLLVLVRTVLEDRTLRQELEGYSDYAERVRYRLLPGIW
ncbi:MAG: isoprenylcysteine carboxylmethyltransferase family protein [Gemmatimonadota bacterium]|nr:MAG: isoprenylcysteine carboxylmethyltransferase family protein [Gemmatimonadota bacterium]